MDERVEGPPVPGPGAGDRAAMVYVAVGNYADLWSRGLAGWVLGGPGRDAGVLVAGPGALDRVSDEALGAWLRGMVIAARGQLQPGPPEPGSPEWRREREGTWPAEEPE